MGHMQVCTSLQTDNHASTPPLSFLTGQMPFLPPNQQRQSTEGNKQLTYKKNSQTQSSLVRLVHSKSTELTCNKSTQLYDAFIGQHRDSIGCSETRTVSAQSVHTLWTLSMDWKARIRNSSPVQFSSCAVNKRWWSGYWPVRVEATSSWYKAECWVEQHQLVVPPYNHTHARTHTYTNTEQAKYAQRRH